MIISFIILTYNRTDTLLEVLKSLASQCGSDHEVIIADDGSSQAAVSELFAKCPKFACPVHHVWHPDTGFTAAKARNMAAKVSKGHYLVFVDGDCVPGPSFVKQHEILAESGCFVNGSRVLLSEEFTNMVLTHKIPVYQLSPWYWTTAWFKRHSNKLFHFVVWPWRLFRVKPGFGLRGIRSCNFGVFRSNFFSVNGFDETFNGWGHEDIDLALRLNHLGLKRKNGFLATEVFHLWHSEKSRDRALENWKKVESRIITRQILADQGLNCTEDSSVITKSIFN